MGERGGIQAIVKGMEVHEEDESLLLHACTALTNLLHNNTDNRKRLAHCSLFIVHCSLL